MHYWRKNNALQTLGVPWPAAAGPPGPGGHYFFTNNALVGILIKVLFSNSGLDPAGPWFEDKPITVGLDPSCATLVDVWHTHGKRGVLPSLGTERPLGHVDFYPNGGGQQPGCRVKDLFRRGQGGRRQTPGECRGCI